MSDTDERTPVQSSGSKHRHHHHRKGRRTGSSRKSGYSPSVMLDADEAGSSVAQWRHEAHVKDHEIRILKKMVQSAKEEINKKEKTVAKMVERMPAFQADDTGFSKEALDMIETLERKLSEREYQQLKMQQDLESAQVSLFLKAYCGILTNSNVSLFRLH